MKTYYRKIIAETTSSHCETGTNDRILQTTLFPGSIVHSVKDLKLNPIWFRIIDLDKKNMLVEIKHEFDCWITYSIDPALEIQIGEFVDDVKEMENY